MTFDTIGDKMKINLWNEKIAKIDIDFSIFAKETRGNDNIFYVIVRHAC